MLILGPVFLKCLNFLLLQRHKNLGISNVNDLRRFQLLFAGLIGKEEHHGAGKERESDQDRIAEGIGGVIFQEQSGEDARNGGDADDDQHVLFQFLNLEEFALAIDENLTQFLQEI